MGFLKFLNKNKGDSAKSPDMDGIPKPSPGDSAGSSSSPPMPPTPPKAVSDDNGSSPRPSSVPVPPKPIDLHSREEPVLPSNTELPQDKDSEMLPPEDPFGGGDGKGLPTFTDDKGGSSDGPKTFAEKFGTHPEKDTGSPPPKNPFSGPDEDEDDSFTPPQSFNPSNRISANELPLHEQIDGKIDEHVDEVHGPKPGLEMSRPLTKEQPQAPKPEEKLPEPTAMGEDEDYFGSIQGSEDEPEPKKVEPSKEASPSPLPKVEKEPQSPARPAQKPSRAPRQIFRPKPAKPAPKLKMAQETTVLDGKEEIMTEGFDLDKPLFLSLQVCENISYEIDEIKKHIKEKENEYKRLTEFDKRSESEYGSFKKSLEELHANLATVDKKLFKTSHV